MSSIQNQVQQIALVLRSQLASLRTSAPIGRVAKGAKQHVPAAKSNNTPASPDLADVLAQRVQQIDSNDPLCKRKVLRIFLESVISAEFGHSLCQDVRFSSMIDSVQQQMEADPQLDPMMNQMVDALMKAKA